MPFLSIVTRRYKRPKMLRTNIISVACQTSRDWEHIFITDGEGRGILWANQSLYHNRHRVRGRYVLILDDDNCLAYSGLVEDLKVLVNSLEPGPDIIMVKEDQILRTLPDNWEKYPTFGHIDTGCFIIRNELWQRHIEVFGQPNGGDYTFISTLFAMVDSNGWLVSWFDKVAVRVQKVSRGKPETDE